MTQDAASRDGSVARSEERLDSFDVLLRRVAELCDSDIDRITVPVHGEVVGGKYCVDQQLAIGGMGAVLRATHLVSGKAVALKWLLPTAERAAARFLREVRAAARVDHPNVVDVYDLGTHRGGHYLVMELLHGRSLGTRLRAGRLRPAELVGIMVPVLRGLAAAHAQGVIHRDLKPDNVFLCDGPDGTPREPKVLDFGISKLRESAEDSEALTSSGTGIGTPAYMAPEQLADARSVDERADIYAAGVIMYEALTGCLPFQRGDRAARASARSPARPLPPRTLEPSVPLALQRIVLKAMATDASERHESADALASELSALTGLDAARVQRPGQYLVRRRGLVALATLAASLSLWLMVSQSVGETGVRAPRREPSEFAARSATQATPAQGRSEAEAHRPQSHLSSRADELAQPSPAAGHAPDPSASAPREEAGRFGTDRGQLSDAQSTVPVRRRTATRLPASATAVTPRAGKIYLNDL